MHGTVALLDVLSVCAEIAPRVVQLVVLSDRISEEEMDIKQPPIPTLLAVGAVHHHLIRLAPLPHTCICQQVSAMHAAPCVT